MSVIALIPARKNSKGCAGKNWRRLGGKTIIGHAYECALAAGVDRAVVSSDRVVEYAFAPFNQVEPPEVQPFLRPAELAQDDTPMIAVVQHALEQIPGQPDDIIVLLQPTQPLRKPEHVQAAIALLRDSGADSVVSVVALPLTHSPEFQLHISAGVLRLTQYEYGSDLMDLPARRQDAEQAYIRDGTVYAFWRRTVERYKSIYGYASRPLIIPPEDTCELDTEADWAALEARWKARHG